MYISEKNMNLSLTTCCTLNCKLCGAYSPLYEQLHKNVIIPFSELKFEIDKLFQIYDYIEDFTLTGGEPLIHTNIVGVLNHVLKYKEQFNICRIFTNGTLIPSNELIDLMKNNSGKMQFVIDDYGPEKSINAGKIKEIADINKIPCRINIYYGENQHCNGWINFGSFSENRKYSQNILNKLFANCHAANWKCLTTFKGKVFLCNQAAVGSDLGFFKLNKDEYFDLHDENLTLEGKKEIAAKLGTKPTIACQYCNGFDVENSKRYPAAEQAPRGAEKWEDTLE